MCTLNAKKCDIRLAKSPDDGDNVTDQKQKRYVVYTDALFKTVLLPRLDVHQLIVIA